MCSVSVQMLYTMSHTVWIFLFSSALDFIIETVAGQACTV